jgi:hypothetical protein
MVSTSLAFDVRRENLRRLILEKYEGNRAAFARAANVHQNQVNLLLSDNDQHRRNLGEALARRMEEAVGLPVGYFDLPPHGDGGAIHTVRALDIAEPLRNLLRRSSGVVSVQWTDAGLGAIRNRITDPANLFLAHITTSDMAPDIVMDELVVIDGAVKAISQDGVYIIQHGNDYFLRRVQKSLSGGYTISTPNVAIENIKVDNLRGIKAMGRVAMVMRRGVL